MKEVMQMAWSFVRKNGYSMSEAQASLSKMLGGNPTIGTLEKIADALGVPVTELFEKSNTGDIVGFVKIGYTVHEVMSAEDVKDLAERL